MPTPAPQRRRPLLLRALPLLAFAPVLAASLLAASARWFWAGELMVSLAFHLGLACFAIAAVCLALRAPRLAVGAVLLGLWHAGPELALSIPRRVEPLRADEVELTVATCNVLWDNPDPESLPRWLAARRPDVATVQEVSPPLRERLEQLVAEGGWHLALQPAPSDWTRSTWGTAILSRLPLESTRILEPARGRPPLEAAVRVGGRRVTVRCTHPVRPGHPALIAERDLVLDAIAAAPWEGTHVLAGDLNTASTSPVFRRLLRAGRLRDSRAGFGRQPSFLLKKRMPRDFGLPLAIDHVLVTSDVRVLARETSELEGSDHRAVLARLAIPRAAEREEGTR